MFFDRSINLENMDCTQAEWKRVPLPKSRALFSDKQELNKIEQKLPEMGLSAARMKPIFEALWQYLFLTCHSTGFK